MTPRALAAVHLLPCRGIQQLAHRPPDTPPEQIKAPDAMASKMSDKVRGEGERGEEGEEGRGEGACQEAMASKMSDKVRGEGEGTAGEEKGEGRR